MTSWKTAYLSIGTNKGDKRCNLDNAIALLKKEKNIEVKAVSGYYKTAPQNYKDQDWFVNAALKIYTRHDPEALLDVLKTLEHEMDKDGKPFRFGPRIIDLDIIFYESITLKTERLELPHPRMHERCFVLKPLSDIDGSLVHPVFNRTTDQLLKQINIEEDQAVIALDQEENSEIFY